MIYNKVQNNLFFLFKKDNKIIIYYSFLFQNKTKKEKNMWIKLHLQNGNQTTYIQTQHITHLNKTMGGTVAIFLSDGNVCVVNETIDEIGNMITE